MKEKNKDGNTGELKRKQVIVQKYYLTCMKHHPKETPLFWPYVFESKNEKEALKMAKRKLRSDSEDKLLRTDSQEG